MSESPPQPCKVRRLESLDAGQVGALAELLMDCVAGGASVHFLAGLDRGRAEGFWRRVADEVAAGRRAFLVAEDERGICGTVHLILDMPENQPHRAELVKMLVHRRARRRGVGEALLTHAEALARDCGRTLLVLDTVTDGDGARLYERAGWVRVGDVPRFALDTAGKPCGATYYYRDLAP